MGHQLSTPHSSKPEVSKIWSNIFEPVIIPRAECQTIRTTYNIFATPSAEPELPSTYETHCSKLTAQFFALWTPSNLFNAVQPLKNDYKIRSKIQGCLSCITKPGDTIPVNLQLPIVIHLYLARQHSPNIDDAHLSAYIKTVYNISMVPEHIASISDRIVNLEKDTLHERHIPHSIGELSDRLFDFDVDRLMHLHQRHPIKDLVLFMDSVWLSLSPAAQQATLNEWSAYAEPDWKVKDRKAGASK